MILNTYNSIQREHLEKHLYAAVYTLVYDVVYDLASKNAMPEAERTFVVNYYKIALVGLLLEWIRNNMSEDPKIIIAYLDKIVTGEYHRILART